MLLDFTLYGFDENVIAEFSYYQNDCDLNSMIIIEATEVGQAIEFYESDFIESDFKNYGSWIIQYVIPQFVGWYYRKARGCRLTLYSNYGEDILKDLYMAILEVSDIKPRLLHLSRRDIVRIYFV